MGRRGGFAWCAGAHGTVRPVPGRRGALQGRQCGRCGCGWWTRRRAGRAAVAALGGAPDPWVGRVGVGVGWRGGVGAVWSWADRHRCFLTASRMVHGIRWWRGSGCRWFRGAAVVWVGGAGYCHSQRRSQKRQSRAPPAAPARRAASLRGVGGRAGCRRTLLVVAFVPASPVASSPGGNHPALGGVKPDRRSWWSGISRLDTTGPACLATPAEATGNPGQTHLWEGFPHHTHTPPGRRRASPSGPRPHHRPGLSRIPRRFGGACTTIPDWAMASFRVV